MPPIIQENSIYIYIYVFFYVDIIFAHNNVPNYVKKWLLLLLCNNVIYLWILPCESEYCTEGPCTKYINCQA